MAVRLAPLARPTASSVLNLLLLLPQELERQKHTCNVLQHKQEELKEGIRQRDELIEVRPPGTGATQGRETGGRATGLLCPETLRPRPLTHPSLFRSLLPPLASLLLSQLISMFSPSMFRLCHLKLFPK